VYATVPSNNVVIVIETTSLEVIKTIPIGSTPLGLAVSADGKKLWVANSGSTAAAIGVVDLDTLTTLPSLPAPKRPFDIEEGGDHKLYLSQIEPAPLDGGIMRIDAETGEFETAFGGTEVNSQCLLEISPDRRTLFVADTGLSPSTLVKYDVAPETPALVQLTSAGSNGEGLRLSHNGRFLVFPNGGGNGSGYDTFEISTADLNSIYGTFQIGAYPVAAAFSNDDTLLYHAAASQSEITIFDTVTFAPTGTIPLGPPGEYGFEIKDTIVDSSGRWLFVATGLYSTEGDLRIYDTGRDDALPPPQLGNISTRVNVGRGDDVLIGGFIVKGNVPKKVIVRAIGPSLLGNGVPGALANPTVELHDETGAIIATNDNWRTTVIGGIIASNQVAAIQDSGVAPTHVAESAIVAILAPGNYTAVVRGKDDSTGIGLAEAYDLDPAADSKLANISTRGFVGAGDNVMIGGTIVTGSTPVNVLIRAIGPSLTDLGVSNALADPTLELHDADGALIAANDNWRDDQESEIEATQVAPSEDMESAILATLPPGNHTAIVRGKNGAVGVALVEAYQLNN
jgi:YVTN family beta-propeller protein